MSEIEATTPTTPTTPTNDAGETGTATETQTATDTDAATSATTSRVRACAFADLAEEGAQRFDLEDPATGATHRVAVVRIEEAIYVIGDRCTHADISLAAGDIDPDECSIECPKHGSTFLLETGEPTSMPAVRPVPVYEAEVVDGDVIVVLPTTKSVEGRS